MLQYPIVIDEAQKVPALLDEIHWLIENTKAYFILCGSNARKLKRGAANLLGGRAWRFEFFPLVSAEIPEFNLLQALNIGMLPKYYPQNNAQRLYRKFMYLMLVLQDLLRNVRLQSSREIWQVPLLSISIFWN